MPKPSRPARPRRVLLLLLVAVAALLGGSTAAMAADPAPQVPENVVSPLGGVESPAVVLEGLLYLGDSAALETIHAEYENMAPPTPLPPMLAVSGDVPEGDQWVYDWKWDGVRAIVGIEAKSVT